MITLRPMPMPIPMPMSRPVLSLWLLVPEEVGTRKPGSEGVIEGVGVAAACGSVEAKCPVREAEWIGIEVGNVRLRRMLLTLPCLWA